jgi:hypothetical protein
LLNNNGIAYNDNDTFNNRSTNEPIYSHSSPPTHTLNPNQYSQKQSNSLNHHSSKYFNTQSFHKENFGANGSNQPIYGDGRSMSRSSGSGLYGSNDSRIKNVQRPSSMMGVHNTISPIQSQRPESAIYQTGRDGSYGAGNLDRNQTPSLTMNQSRVSNDRPSSVRGVHQTISPAQIQRPASAIYQTGRDGSYRAVSLDQTQSPSLTTNQSRVSHDTSGSVNIQRPSSAMIQGRIGPYGTNKTPPSSTMNPRLKGASRLPSMTISHREEPRISSRQSVQGNPNNSSARANSNNRLVTEKQLNNNQEYGGNSNSKYVQPNPFIAPSTFRPSVSSNTNNDWNRPKTGGNLSFTIPENHSLSRMG